MPFYDLDEMICERHFHQKDLVITDLEKDVCMGCGKKYTHRRINFSSLELQKDYEGLYDVEFILECAKCRSERKKIKELRMKIEKLEEEILNIEYDAYSRKNNKNKET